MLCVKLKIFPAVIALVFFTAGVLDVAAAAPVGMACHVKGKPEVKRGGGGWKPLRLLQRLQPGDAVKCGAESEAIIVLFAKGERFKIGAGAEGVVEPGSVRGAVEMGSLKGSSSRVARSLGGARVGAFMARPAQSHQRITRQHPGWMLEGERAFTWEAIPNAASYSFSLFDQFDNVVWSARATTPSAEYPQDLLPLSLKRPYVWRIIPFGKSGKPLAESRWGVMTVLSRADADSLTAEEKELQEQAKASADDVTSLVLLAELYREYGVLERTLEILEDQRLAAQPGAKQALEETYAQVSRYARTLAGLTGPQSSDMADEEGVSTPNEDGPAAG